MVQEAKVINLRDMVLMALFAAIFCVLAPLAIPIGPVPVSLTNFVVFISVYILGWHRTVITYVVYLLIGLAGLPVFSGFQGGLGKMAGPTGGYLIGFIFTAVIAGLFTKFQEEKVLMNRIRGMVGMILGMIVAYGFGTAWFCYSTGTGLSAALALCVFPFIPGDLVKMVIAVTTAPAMAEQIRKVG